MLFSNQQLKKYLLLDPHSLLVSDSPATIHHLQLPSLLWHFELYITQSSVIITLNRDGSCVQIYEHLYMYSIYIEIQCAEAN